MRYHDNRILIVQHSMTCLITLYYVTAVQSLKFSVHLPRRANEEQNWRRQSSAFSDRNGSFCYIICSRIQHRCKMISGVESCQNLLSKDNFHYLNNTIVATVNKAVDTKLAVMWPLPTVQFSPPQVIFRNSRTHLSDQLAPVVGSPGASAHCRRGPLEMFGF